MPIWRGVLAELAARQPPDFDGVRRNYLVALHRHTGRNVILYASGWLQRESPPGLVSIGDEDMQAFMEVSHGLDGDLLDLILHSPGGSPEAAEAIVSYLRSRFSHIRVIVPQLAGGNSSRGFDRCYPGHSTRFEPAESDRWTWHRRRSVPAWVSSRPAHRCWSRTTRP